MSLPNRKQWFIVGIAVALLVLIAGIAIFFTRTPSAGRVGDTNVKAEWVDKLATAQKVSRPQAMAQIVQALWELRWAEKNNVSLQGSAIIDNTPQYKALPLELKELLGKGVLINTSLANSGDVLSNIKVSKAEIAEYTKNIRQGEYSLVGFDNRSEAQEQLEKMQRAKLAKRQSLFLDIMSKYGSKTAYFISQQGSIITDEGAPASRQAKLYTKTFTQDEVDRLVPPNSPLYKQSIAQFKDKTFYILAFNIQSNQETSPTSIIAQLKLSKLVKKKAEDQKAYKNVTTCQKQYASPLVCGK